MSGETHSMRRVPASLSGASPFDFSDWSAESWTVVRSLAITVSIALA